MSEPTKVIPSSFSLRPNTEFNTVSGTSRTDKLSSTEPVPIMFIYQRYLINSCSIMTLDFSTCSDYMLFLFIHSSILFSIPELTIQYGISSNLIFSSLQYSLFILSLN